MKKTYEKLFELVLVAMVILSLVGCAGQPTNVEVFKWVQNSVTIFQNPAQTAWVIYGALPREMGGKEIIAVVSQVSQASEPVLSATSSGAERVTIEITQNLTEKGWRIIPFLGAPNAVQLAIMSAAENAMIAFSDAVGASLIMPIGVFDDLPYLQDQCIPVGDTASCNL